MRKETDPQAASRTLVDHALARFSTDNLSVMLVRFDPKTLQANTSTDIGVETDASHEKGAISEAQMLVSEARHHSNAVRDGTMDEEEEAKGVEDMVIHEKEEEEPGPELDPEGGKEAERILAEKRTLAEKTLEGGGGGGVTRVETEGASART